MRRMIFGAALAAGAALGGGAANAACEADKPGADLGFDEAQAVYDCLAGEMAAGYRQGGKGWIPAEYVNDYRSWTKASTVPAAPGFHGGRFLLTWVNAVGAEAYLQYAENPTIPAGTVIAKESFTVGEDGKAAAGPLFIMEKAPAGASPESMDWYYMMVAPDGRPQAVDVMAACSACHMENYGETGGLGYPVEEARVGN